KEAFALAHEKEKWRLVQPVTADVNAGAAADLAQTLGRLDIVEFIAETPKKEDLDKVYGLDKPAVTATLTLADAKKPPRGLRIGKESTDKKEHYFARVDEGPVFLIRKGTLETVQKDALAYRTLPLWDVPAERISEVRIKKDDSGFTLKREGGAWKITEPFTA